MGPYHEKDELSQNFTEASKRSVIILDPMHLIDAKKANFLVFRMASFDLAHNTLELPIYS